LILLKGEEYLELISDHRFKTRMSNRFKFIDLIDVQRKLLGYNFLSHRLIAIFPRDGELTSYLNINNIKSNNLDALWDLIQWDRQPNRKFIYHICKTIYGCQSSTFEFDRLLTELDKKLITRKDLVQKLVDQIIEVNINKRKNKMSHY
jgi:hypothetical protein